MPSRDDSRIAALLHRWLVRAYPADLHRRFAYEWERLFLDLYAERRARGRRHAALFLLRNIVDALVFGLPARITRRRKTRTAKLAFTRRPRVEEVVADLTFGARFLMRQKLLSATAISCLALGIGSTAAVFSLFDALVVRPLPIRGADRLAGMISTREHGTNRTFAYTDFEVLRDAVAPDISLIAYSSTAASFRSGEATERISIELVSNDYFEKAGVRPAAGVLFARSEAGASAVLSHSFWQRRFGGDPTIIGRSVHLNQQRVNVIGVTPRGFLGLNGVASPQIWLPLGLQPALQGRSRLDGRSGWLLVAGWRAPGFSLEQARSRLEAVALAQWSEVGKSWEKGVVLEPAPTGFPAPLSDYRPYLKLSMGLVALVLALTSINVSGLLLAAGEARRGEIVTRQCLGARRSRLLQQLLTENLLMSGLAAALGCGVAAVLVRLLTRNEPLASRLGEIAVGIDGRVLFFALAATLGSALVAGLFPALSLSRAQSGLAAARVGRSATSFATQRSFLGVQVALSFTLLVAAVLSLASLEKLRAIDPGVERAPILMASIDLRTAGYETRAVQPFWERLLSGLDELPGVRSSALTLSRPVDPAGRRMTVEIPGYVPQADEDMEIDVNNVSPAYFDTLGIDVLQGRGFTERDERLDSGAVVLVNETAAARYWPDGTAIGSTLRFGLGDAELRVVGIARDGKYRNLREEARPLIYLPQGRYAAGGDRMSLLVRTDGEPLDQVEALRRLVRDLDPDIPLYEILTLEQQLERAIANDRLTTYLFSALAVFAMLLAGAGLLGLLTFWVRTRRREIGIRMAMGARPANVAVRIVFVALPPLAVGLLLGWIGALSLGRLLGAQLYGVHAADPFLYLSAAALFVLVALAATLLPTRLATRIQPLNLLRVD